MTYPVNPNDPTTPTNQQGAAQGAEELRALKALVASLVVVAASGSSPRQSIQSAVLDSSGYNAALTVGAGLRPALVASATNPFHLSFAAGFNGGKTINNEEAFVANNADILGVDLPLSNTVEIFRNYGAGYDFSLVPFHEGNIFDRSVASLLHFEEAVTPLDDFGNTYTITGAALTATKPAYGAKSLDCSGGAGTITNVKRAETTNIVSLGNGSWEASCVVWFDVLPNAATLHYLISAINNPGLGAVCGWTETGGNRRAFMHLSADTITNNIGTGNGITNLAIGVWYRFRMIFDALAGAYRLYVAAGGSAAAPVWTAEVQEISIASTLRVCAITRFIWGASYSGAYTNGISGFIDEARFIRGASKTSVETPGTAPNVLPYSVAYPKINFFNISKMTAYEVTAASVVQNTDPTLTAVSRLKLAEVDTSGVAVTAVRNYAIQGQFVGEDPLTPFTTRISKNHNIGSIPRNWKVVLVNNSENDGYVPGDEIAVDTLYRGANLATIQTSVDKKTIGIISNTATIAAYNKTTAADTGLTITKWKTKFYASRGW